MKYKIILLLLILQPVAHADFLIPIDPNFQHFLMFDQDVIPGRINAVFYKEEGHSTSRYLVVSQTAERVPQFYVTALRVQQERLVVGIDPVKTFGTTPASAQVEVQWSTNGRRHALNIIDETLRIDEPDGLKEFRLRKLGLPISIKGHGVGFEISFSPPIEIANIKFHTAWVQGDQISFSTSEELSYHPHRLLPKPQFKGTFRETGDDSGEFQAAFYKDWLGWEKETSVTGSIKLDESKSLDLTITREYSYSPAHRNAYLPGVIMGANESTRYPNIVSHHSINKVYAFAARPEGFVIENHLRQSRAAKLTTLQRSGTGAVSSKTCAAATSEKI